MRDPTKVNPGRGVPPAPVLSSPPAWETMLIADATITDANSVLTGTPTQDGDGWITAVVDLEAVAHSRSADEAAQIAWPIATDQIVDRHVLAARIVFDDPSVPAGSEAWACVTLAPNYASPGTYLAGLGLYWDSSPEQIARKSCAGSTGSASTTARATATNAMIEPCYDGSGYVSYCYGAIQDSSNQEIEQKDHNGNHTPASPLKIGALIGLQNTGGSGTATVKFKILRLFSSISGG